MLFMDFIAEIRRRHLISGERTVLAFSAAQESPSGIEKSEQVGIELVFMRDGEAVRPTRIDLQGDIFDELGRGMSRGSDRHNLVVVTVDD